MLGVIFSLDFEGDGGEMGGVCWIRGGWDELGWMEGLGGGSWDGVRYFGS